MKESSSVGLDLGNRHINMVKLSRTSLKGWQLRDFVSLNLTPSQSLKEEKIRQLAKIVQEKKMANLAVNIGVSGESVIVRYIDFPRMNREEIRQALTYEAQQYIPFKMEEVIFDYHILESAGLRPNSNSNRMKILLVAAKKETIMESVELIQRLGLRPNLIDVDSFSLINCFQINGPKVKNDEAFALVNLEFDLVNINILQAETPFFFRDISLLEDILSLRQEQPQRPDLFKAMEPLLKNLIREISLSIDYFESEFEKQIGTIYLSGEGAKVPELIDFFRSQLGREIKLWDPLKDLMISSTEIDSQFLKEVSCRLAIACGLAFRGVQ